MRVKVARRVVVLAGAAALAMAAVIVPASGATSPGWRVVKTFGPAEGVWSDSFAVSGANDAWSTWIACKPCTGSNQVTHYYLEHSAGTTWKQVRVPVSLAQSAEASVGIGASSFRNMWLFDAPAGKSAQTKVLRWNGRKWHVQSIPAWAVHFNLSGTYDIVPAVFGPTSVWVFSMGVDAFSNPDHYAARYNGHTWTKTQLPGVPSQVSILSRDDIWAVGNTVATKTKPSATILMHWNGKHWHTLAVPEAHVPAHASEYVADPVALGPADVWIKRDILRGTAGAATLYLLHWNGSSWRRVAIPAQISGVDYMTQDGHGGLWLAANGPKPAYRWHIYHLNGRWTRDSVPAAKGTTVGDLIGLNWIPGTRSVWAAGNMFLPGTNGGILGAILKHGG
jgi:hypothetical protein